MGIPKVWSFLKYISKVIKNIEKIFKIAKTVLNI
jgi:hypothetical protein